MKILIPSRARWLSLAALWWGLLATACASPHDSSGAYKVTATGMLGSTDCSAPTAPAPTQASDTSFIVIATREGGLEYVLSASPSPDPNGEWFDDQRGGWSRAGALFGSDQSCRLEYQTLSITFPTSSAIHLDVRKRYAYVDRTSCTEATAIDMLEHASYCDLALLWDGERAPAR